MVLRGYAVIMKEYITKKFLKMGTQKNDNKSRVKERSEIQEKSKEILYVNKKQSEKAEYL